MAQRTPSILHRTWRDALASAALIAVARPATWPLALAGFLARGGILALLLPIVVMPTPSGIADVIAPAIVPFAFGLVAPAFVVLVVSVALLVATWVMAGGFVGAWADVELVREVVADDEAVVAPMTDRQHPVFAAFAVRLLSAIPLALALSVAAVEIVTAAYAELTSPIEVVTPLFVRVLSDVPAAIGLVVVAWAVSEAAGGMAVRHLLLGGASVPVALRDGWLDFVRRPLSTAGTLILTDLAVIAAVASTIFCAGVAWSGARFALLAGEPLQAPVAVVLLVVVWLGGVVLIGVAAAWRSAAWTLEVARSDRVGTADPSAEERAVGTFGGPEHARPGG
jgi:hypothetical protein